MKIKNKKISFMTLELIFFAFIAKGLGFVREMVLAFYYGANYIADVFVAVQNIPAIIFTVFGTTVTTGFIPKYTEIKVNKNKEEADSFANNVFNIFLFLCTFLTLLGVLFSKQLVKLFLGGFEGKTFMLCNVFVKIVMPTSIAIVLIYIYNAYLQIEGYFTQNSLMNVPYNLIQIIFIVIGFYSKNVYFLATGLLLSSFGQLVYLRFLIKKNTDFHHVRVLKFNDTNIKNMLLLVGPVFISTGVNQLNSIIDRFMASGLIEGRVSALNFSGEVANIVTQVIILSFSTILYPKMTEIFIKNDKEVQNKFVLSYINVVTLLVLPLAALIFILSEEIIQVLFGRGAFNRDMVLSVSRALRIYALGVVGASFRDVLNKVFYAMKDTKTPMINGTIAVAMNILLNILLVKHYDYLGLAFATAFSASLCTVLLFIRLKKNMRELNYKHAIITMVKAILSTVFMCMILSYAMPVLSSLSDTAKCIIGGMIGLVVYIGGLIWLKEQLTIGYLKKIHFGR